MFILVLLNGDSVKDGILAKVNSAMESVSYFWVNVTKSLQDSTKGGLTLDSGLDWIDPFCGTLCCVSIGCEVILGVLVWWPIPSKYWLYQL